MAFLEVLVRLVSLGERITLRDLNLKFCRLHRLVEALELAHSGNRVNVMLRRFLGAGSMPFG